MAFKSRYLHRRNEKPEYYRTIHADTLNEAIKQAERYTKKGYICVGITSQ